MKSKLVLWRSGPVWPKPVTEAMISRGLMADSDS